MKRTVGCFTEEKLRELAETPNVTVMQPTHDIVFQPWCASKVMECVDRVATLTKSGCDPGSIRQNPLLDEFASKYTTFFSKLTDPLFVADREHIAVMKRIIVLHGMVQSGTIDEQTGQAQSADIALKSLAKRADSR